MVHFTSPQKPGSHGHGSKPRFKDAEFDFQTDLEELIGLAQRRQLGPSTASLVRAAEERDIPWIRLNDYSLVLWCPKTLTLKVP